MRRAAVLLCAAVLVGGCSDGAERPEATPPTASTPSPSTSKAPSTTLTPTPHDPPTTPARFEPDRALRHVEVLAGQIGPRLATGPAFREAAAYVVWRFEQQGYAVRRQWFPVPAGDSWGVPVEAGRSFNVIATSADFDAAAPYRIIGAHLDTVAVAPGAEDNASGVAVLLELARLANAAGTKLPTVLVAFGAEEPRGTADDQHHFGSRHYVGAMSPSERRNLRAMVSMDRVGVGGSVPVCTGGLGTRDLRDDLLDLASRLEIPAAGCADNRSSDHWSFEKAGFDVARLGSTPYAGYHSAGDVPSVVGRQQLDRTGRLSWGWLRAPDPAR